MTEDKYEILEVTTHEIFPGEYVGYVGYRSKKYGKEQSYIGGNPTKDESKARLWACNGAIAQASMRVE